MTIENNIRYNEGSGVPDELGNKRWFQNGQLHRVEGPAVVLAYGYKEWWINNKLHRVDGPAIEDIDGHKAWYQNGKRHRKDGPAVEWSDGTKFWYLNGKKAIVIKDQKIEIGKKVIIRNDVGITLRHFEGLFYEVLLGNKKILVVSLEK